MHKSISCSRFPERQLESFTLPEKAQFESRQKKKDMNLDIKQTFIYIKSFFQHAESNLGAGDFIRVWQGFQSELLFYVETFLYYTIAST